MQDNWNVKKQERLSKDTCCSGYQDQTNSCTVMPVNDLKSSGFLDNYSMKAKREQIDEEPSNHKAVCK